MSHKQAIQIRGKIIGVLIRDARLASGKSLKEVGEALDVTGGRISLKSLLTIWIHRLNIFGKTKLSQITIKLRNLCQSKPY